MIPDTWIEHRREDGERIGWIELDGDACDAPAELQPWTGDVQDAIDSLSGENAQRPGGG